MTCGTFKIVKNFHFRAVIYSVSRFLNSFGLDIAKAVCEGCLEDLVAARRFIILSLQEQLTSSKRISTILLNEVLNCCGKLLQCINFLFFSTRFSKAEILLRSISRSFDFFLPLLSFNSLVHSAIFFSDQLIYQLGSTALRPRFLLLG